jgi:hypothetical protein
MATPRMSVRSLRTYLRVVGAALLAQGVLTVALGAISGEAARRTHGVLNHDVRHGALHVVWGLALLTVALRERGARRLVVGAIVFGVFYLALGALGIVTHNPFGLRLGAGENGFHLIIGSTTLAAGAVAHLADRRLSSSELAPSMGDG